MYESSSLGGKKQEAFGSAEQCPASEERHLWTAPFSCGGSSRTRLSGIDRARRPLTNREHEDAVLVEKEYDDSCEGLGTIYAAAPFALCRLRPMTSDATRRLGAVQRHLVQRTTSL